MENKNIQEAYKNFKNGNPISDKDLSLLIKNISKTVDGLSKLNDRRFDLLENKLVSDLYILQGYKNSRKRK